jgi:hypothetical protein
MKKLKLYTFIPMWIFGFFVLFSFDLFMEGIVFEWLEWNGTDKNDWFFVLWWGFVFLWFTFGIAQIYFKLNSNNKKSSEVGSLSILEYPDSQELQVWIASDSQYRQVFQVRKYFEDFVYEGFFDEKEIQLKFNNLTWSKMVEYQKRYSNLLNKYSDIYKDTERLNKFVDSLILTEFPEINKFTEEIFKLRYN